MEIDSTMAVSPALVGTSTMRGRRQFCGLRVNEIYASAGAAVLVKIFLRLFTITSIDVLGTRTPASVTAVKVFVRAATCESYIHCGAVKESAIATNVSSSIPDSLSETRAGTATAHTAPEDAPWARNCSSSCNSRIAETATSAR